MGVMATRDAEGLSRTGRQQTSVGSSRRFGQAHAPPRESAIDACHRSLFRAALHASAVSLITEHAPCIAPRLEEPYRILLQMLNYFPEMSLPTYTNAPILEFTVTQSPIANSECVQLSGSYDTKRCI